jgi:hypothetical protein
MNEQSPSTYDPAHGKRIAREITPLVVIIGFVLGWRAHEPWWFILPIALLAGMASYWFWRACDYFAFRLMRGSR